uniref:Uncharacterized protein n=1 Tax=Cacopsylla melanoneura TaxID=428564 RepID=A0A8D9A890_9HEMI
MKGAGGRVYGVQPSRYGCRPPRWLELPSRSGLPLSSSSEISKQGGVRSVDTRAMEVFGFRGTSGVGEIPRSGSSFQEWFLWYRVKRLHEGSDIRKGTVWIVCLRGSRIV